MSAHDTSTALRRALNLIVDSALASDDAITRNDPDCLAKAIKTLTTNANSAKDLAAAWEIAHA